MRLYLKLIVFIFFITITKQRHNEIRDKDTKGNVDEKYKKKKVEQNFYYNYSKEITFLKILKYFHY